MIPEEGPLPVDDAFVEEQKPRAPTQSTTTTTTTRTRRGSCGHWCGGIGEKLKSNLLKVLPAITIDASQEYRNQDQFRVEGAFVFNNNSTEDTREIESSRYARPKSIALQNGDIPDPPIYELKKRARSLSGAKHKPVVEETEKLQAEDEGRHTDGDREPLMPSRE